MLKLENRSAPIVIAEIGCNHKGDIEIAKELVRIAKTVCKVDFVKFQKRNPKELLRKQQYNSPHPEENNSYGSTYGMHREYLEFDIQQHFELKQFCSEIGIKYSCSVWDITSAKEMVELNPEYIKIGSATNTHFRLLELLCETYPGDIHLSLGMTTGLEEKKIFDIFQSHARLENLVLYHSTSGYPVAPKDICLLGINRLREHYGTRIKSIGFSAHYTGIGLDVAAFVLGADYIERHFTLDRSWKGTDHAASLEPDGLRRVRRDTISAAEALTYKTVDVMEVEKPNREKLKFVEK